MTAAAAESLATAIYAAEAVFIVVFAFVLWCWLPWIRKGGGRG